MDFDGWKRRPDKVTLSALLESVEPRVDRICRRILRDPHDAEEAKQEVLLEITSGLDAISDDEHFDRWVGRVGYAGTRRHGRGNADHGDDRWGCPNVAHVEDRRVPVERWDLQRPEHRGDV